MEVLKNENARNVVVIKIPEEMKYTDHMVIVTGISHKHLKGMAEYIRRLFKRKRHPTDVIPRIEGGAKWQRSLRSDWLAIDLGKPSYVF